MTARTLICLAASALAIASGSAAHAADEEIQVYLDEINAPGEVGLDLHINTVASGNAALDYPGQEASRHRWRITPEFSYGVSKTVELGLYLPLATIAPDGKPRAEGAKARIKWLAPHGEEGFYGGANFEIGRVSYRLDENPWNAELKLIGGWRTGRWLVGLNGNFDFVVSGPNPGPASFNLGSKLGYRLSPKVTLGIESYNDFGALRSLGHFSQNDHATYATIDTSIGKWDLNFGIGKGYGTNRDDTIIKLIIGVPIGK